MEKINQRIITSTLSSKIIRLCSSFLLLAVVMFCNAKSALALSLISDEETENFLYNVASPFYKTAQIPINRNKIFIVQDNNLNAFVGDGNNLFINTGTIMNADSRNELSGVVAHEVGHIAGGHILRGKIQAAEMQKIGLASLLLAGAAAVGSGRPDAAVAVMLGGQSSLLQGLTSFRIEQERAADEAAVRFLRQSGESPIGILHFLKKIRQNNKMRGYEESPYFRTHPLTSERINFIEEAIKKYPSSLSKDDETFSRVKAKLIGFISSPEDTYRKYPLSDQSIAASYARAIADFKSLKISQALKKIDALIHQEPNNPYFRELKAQIYMETGKVHQAKKEYAKALDLLPTSALFQINWAQAALETSLSSTDLNKVINVLNQSVIKSPSPMGWLLLSKAYALQKQKAYSEYAAAEYSLSIGNIATARQQVTRAKKISNLPQSLKLKLSDLSKRLNELIN